MLEPGALKFRPRKGNLLLSLGLSHRHIGREVAQLSAGFLIPTCAFSDSLHVLNTEDLSGINNVGNLSVDDNRVDHWKRKELTESSLQFI